MANLISPFRTPSPPAGTPSQLSTYALAPVAISSVRRSASSSDAAVLKAINAQITSPGQPAPARLDPGAIQPLPYVVGASFEATPVSTAPYVPSAVRRTGAPSLPPVNGGAGSSSDQMLKPTPEAPTNMYDDSGAFHVPQANNYDPSLGPQTDHWDSSSMPGGWSWGTPVNADGSPAAAVQPLQQWQLEHGQADAVLRLGLPVAAVMVFGKGNKGVAAALAAGAAVLWANRLGAVRL